MPAEGVHGFQAHTVEAHAGCEDRRVVLGAGVQLRNGVDKAAQGDAATIVAYHGRAVFYHFHFYALAKALVELIDTVVDALFEEHVDAVFGVRSVAKATDVHTGSGADVVGVFEVADFTLVVDYGVGCGGELFF